MLKKTKFKETKLIEVGAICHRGRVREKNQDRILVLEDKRIFLLADGMGGHACGEVASQIAVETIAKEIQSGTNLVNAILKANIEIKIAAKNENGTKDMGTTIVALILTGTKYELAWVGDSRGYKINGGIKQITTDHSLVQELVDHGIISQEKAENHPKRNIITRALGIMEDSADFIEKLTGELEKNETLLLCSDGLHGLINDKHIYQVITKSNGPQAGVNKLVKLALRAGGNDNISIIALSARTEDGHKLKSKILNSLFFRQLITRLNIVL